MRSSMIRAMLGNTLQAEWDRCRARVLAANGVNVMIDDRHGYTPTPVVSHAILTQNRARTSDLADGIVVTPSHNPPRDGGFKHNPAKTGIGKTVVSTSMIDRIAARLGRPLVEAPVGLKWFVQGFTDGTLAFGGEESAGASLLRRDGTVWTTDKDGIVLGLLAAEMTAVTGRDPGELYDDLTREFGDFAYERIDAPATPEQKAALQHLSPDQITASTIAGDRITSRLTEAPGNGASIGGLKVVTENGWFVARPSGTEDLYKLYAESFRGSDHLGRIQEEAQAIIRRTLSAAGTERTPAA